MNSTPVALRLADALDNPPGAPLFVEAAAELRRLHYENKTLHDMCQKAYNIGRQSKQDDLEELLHRVFEVLTSEHSMSAAAMRRRMDLIKELQETLK